MLHASSRHSTPARALHEYGRLVRTIYIWPGGSAHHQTGVEEDVARWHVGLAFQVLDDCFDGKARHLLGGTGRRW